MLPPEAEELILRVREFLGHIQTVPQEEAEKEALQAFVAFLDRLQKLEQRAALPMRGFFTTR